MDRCKLEYMIKRLDLKEQKEMIRLIDPFENYLFNEKISKFLLEPETDDIDILFHIGPAHAIYYSICVWCDDQEFIEPYRKDKESELEEIKSKYINQYKLINELCIKNNTYPFFKDPTNIRECEKTRLDIVRIKPEELINEFFGVDSLIDYEPPFYNSKE